jgi:putative two-component system hydrogenase maturation factor HypX/HoxX
MVRILLLCHAFNSLTQRLFVELRDRGHDVTVEFDINDRVTEEAVALAEPDLIIAPFLKRAIPPTVWRHHRCLVVHPGVAGDRGPTALDWAILDGRSQWGVTVLRATGDLDGGPVCAVRHFPMRAATKSSLYRNEVTEAAVAAVLDCVACCPDLAEVPPPPGVWRNAVRLADRKIDWTADATDRVLAKIRSADGHPGLADRLLDVPVRLFDARRAEGLGGEPGRVVARDVGAVAVATVDGAIWIGHLRPTEGERPIKLPAVRVLGEQRLAGVPQVPQPAEIRYDEAGPVGILSFDFHNGAMGVEQSTRLLEAYRQALTRPTRVLVLAGGADYWSNGIHLNLIEAAASPADESWRSINAIDDLAQAIITTTDRVTVAALQGNAGAGGVFLALAADHVWARQGIVLNPHYKGMGNLYGSEYWTIFYRAAPERRRRPG